MMRRIEVMGFDCPACRKTFRLVEETVRELGIEATLEKVSDPVRITAYRALAVPAIAIDGKLMHSGSAPSRKTITTWLTTLYAKGQVRLSFHPCGYWILQDPLQNARTEFGTTL